jgi:hypothetical protein
MYELDGQAVPSLFVSARTGEGLAALRIELARWHLVSLAASEYPRNTVPQSLSRPPIRHNQTSRRRDRTA